jgi:hypothetical protein
MHYSVLEGTLVRIQHVEEIFFAYILRSFDIPVKRRSFLYIMMYNDVNKHLFEKMY